MLAILLLNANRVVPIDRLADDLYGDAMPSSALTQIQAQVSQLRKLLDPDLAGRRDGFAARDPGARVPDPPRAGAARSTAVRALDSRGGGRLGADDLAAASRWLRDALDLWRGPALAEFAGDPFARIAIARLEDLRFNALADRIDAELALGHHGELVGELGGLVSEYPLRERFRGQLMLALYRSGRQAEALDVYRRVRQLLVEELGIEPTPALQELERAILTQSRSLELARPARTPSEPCRSVLVVASSDARLDGLLAIAEPLAMLPARELILARPVSKESELAPASAAVNARRHSLGVTARAASFVSPEPAGDVLRLATSYDVELVLVDAPSGVDDGDVPDLLAEILEGSPADVAVLAASNVDLRSGDGVFVPFGGGEHDWAALELAAWLASSARVPVRLVGTRAQPPRRQRDASRLLADASLAVQRLVHIDTEPLLAEPTEAALIDACRRRRLVVVGISPRWRTDGIGAMRRALVRAKPPILLAHRGPRPGGLAPRDGRTRFTWSLES